jgi:Fic family protein
MGVIGRTTGSMIRPGTIQITPQILALIAWIDAREPGAPRLMTELVAWVREERESGRLHPLLVIALCIVVFLEFHPFQDGNGWLSRVLTMLLLLQAGYAYVPYSSLENVIEQNR